MNEEKMCKNCEYYTDEKEFHARPAGRKEVLLQLRGICMNSGRKSFHHRVQDTSVKECFVARTEKPVEEQKVVEQEKVVTQPEKPIKKPGRKPKNKKPEETDYIKQAMELKRTSMVPTMVVEGEKAVKVSNGVCEKVLIKKGDGKLVVA